jgi:hypothetical protein
VVVVRLADELIFTTTPTDDVLAAIAPYPIVPGCTKEDVRREAAHGALDLQKSVPTAAGGYALVEVDGYR